MLNSTQRRFGLITSLLFLSVCSAAQEKPAQIKASLPKVVDASVPFYPELARKTHIEGAVTLRVSTDGTRVSDVQAENGSSILARAALENVKTWRFQAGTHSSFEVVFRYRLLAVTCDPRCNCDSEEKESVLLRLPISVEITAKQVMLCDPAVEIRHKR